MKRMWVGIDPGRSSGAMAWTDGHLEGAMPFGKLGDDPTSFAVAYFGFLRKLRDSYPDHDFRCCLERVWASPPRDPTHCRKCKAKLPEGHLVCSRCRSDNAHQMGAQTMFTFGQNFGHLEMGLIACGIPYRLVIPRAWQSPFDLLSKKRESTTEKKNRHKARAMEYFTEMKVTHAIADSLLIAEYCRRTWRME